MITRLSFALVATCVQTALSAQPDAQPPIAAELRALPWGQLNFLHTTDTHGWHGGHLQEAQYGADWGDYISFAQHLHARADNDGSDLLVIDSGDRVEGNGLYDASDPQGRYTFDIIKHQAIDVLTVGNHELYKSATSQREFAEVVPDFKNAYIASNLDIYSSKDGQQVPLARRFKKFKTKNQEIRIIAFGFLFNFHGNANNTVVKPVEQVVQEQWFQDAIRDKEVDLFLVAAHAPVRGGPEIDAIYKAIRDARWNVPIAFFGGHTHIRDYRKLEDKAVALESGRYMETIGFMSISGLGSGKKAAAAPEAVPEYRRMYIDNNLFSMHHHSATNDSTFDTDLGRNVTSAITSARKAMKLDQAYGCAPHDFWLNRAPYPSNASLLTWLEKQVLPDAFGTSESPSIVLANSGAIRFDIFQGPFTIDTTFLVSPFTSGFRAVKAVPYAVASRVLQLLNNEGPITLSELTAMASAHDLSLDNLRAPYVPAGELSIARAADAVVAVRGQDLPQQVLGDHMMGRTPQVPGYTTRDDAGDDGDDTVHAPIQFYAVPNVIAANVGFSAAADEDATEVAAPETVDLVYNEFIQNWVLLALRYLGEKSEVADTTPVLDGKSMTDVLSGWIRENWPCEA